MDVQPMQPRQPSPQQQQQQQEAQGPAPRPASARRPLMYAPFSNKPFSEQPYGSSSSSSNDQQQQQNNYQQQWPPSYPSSSQQQVREKRKRREGVERRGEGEGGGGGGDPALASSVFELLIHVLPLLSPCSAPPAFLFSPLPTHQQQQHRPSTAHLPQAYIPTADRRAPELLPRPRTSSGGGGGSEFGPRSNSSSNERKAFGFGAAPVLPPVLRLQMPGSSSSSSPQQQDGPSAASAMPPPSRHSVILQRGQNTISVGGETAPRGVGGGEGGGRRGMEFPLWLQILCTPHIPPPLLTFAHLHLNPSQPPLPTDPLCPMQSHGHEVTTGEFPELAESDGPVTEAGWRVAGGSGSEGEEGGSGGREAAAGARPRQVKDREVSGPENTRGRECVRSSKSACVVAMGVPFVLYARSGILPHRSQPLHPSPSPPAPQEERQQQQQQEEEEYEDDFCEDDRDEDLRDSLSLQRHACEIMIGQVAFDEL
jgi:hypothetical protein